MTYDLGVDLGTAYTCAVVSKDGRTDVVQLGGTSNLIPSVVSVREDGTVLTGEAAERRTVTDPARTVREFKRRFGDDAPFVIGGVPYGAEALVGHLLASVIAAVTQVEGAPPDHVALTHPADYGPFKLDLLTHAAHLAGVEEPVLVAEPVAAAIAYAEREGVAPGQHLLVYDLGGGTFDAAVVRLDPSGPVVVGTPEGLARLGGIDFDQAVLAHVEAVTGGAVTALDSTDPAARAALARLRADCQAAKEALSDDTETEIPVLLPQVRTSVRLTREELESMVGPRLTDTARVLERVVASAGLTMPDIATVLLVGGSSRMPSVAQLVREHTGRPVAVDANPKTTVAAGAAVLAARGATAAQAAAPTVVVPAVLPAAPEVAAPAATAAADASPTPPASPPASPRPPASEGGSNGRSRKGLVLALVAVVAVLAIVAAVAMSGGDDKDGTDVATGDTGTTEGEQTVTTDAPSSDGGSTPAEVPEGWLQGDVRQRVDEAIAGFDTGNTDLHYETAANYDDGGGVTAGRAYFSTAYCDALAVIEAYTETVPENGFAPFLDELSTLCTSGSDDTSGLPEAEYVAAWVAASDDDPAFRAAQDRIVNENYFDIAMFAADEAGATMPLTRFALYDTAWMQMGSADGEFSGLVRRTNEAVGKIGDVDEVTWLYQFLDLRRDALQEPDDAHPEWAEQVHRVECLFMLADAEAYDLDAPITCTAFGSEFTTS